MNNDNLVQLLILVVGIIGLCIFGLIITLIIMNAKEKKIEKQKQKQEDEKKKVKKSEVIYSAEPIEDFMNFEKIEDNMIIQKKGKFLMIVECKGINYDLMSEIEKASVEQGFIAFLNTLRYPIQLYIQTRTINLNKSIQGYKERLGAIEKSYSDAQVQYEQALKDENMDRSKIDRLKYELVKQKNLKEYTTDIIRDIERQSLNKNILSKKYYVIIPCYSSEIAIGDFDKTEIKNMAFSELYTRARAIINSLFACQVTGKILNSDELIELLYIAYNRDESDLFWLDKMKEAGLEDLYSTAPDVIEKKIKLLDEEIEAKAIALANQKIGEVRRDKEIEALEKENNQEEFVKKTAKEIINKHKKYIGDEIAKKTIEKIEEDMKNNNKKGQKQLIEKEETQNGIVQEKNTRGRSKRK